MVTRLLPVDLKRNNWFDGEQVTEDDLLNEQNRNIGIDSAIENNFFESGILPEFSIAPTIFDTNLLNSTQQALLDAYAFDGQNCYVGTDLATVSDEINGVNLAVTISNCRLDGAAKIYVSIIGDSFGDTLIHDDLIYELNGTQVTKGRYINIRAILLNNFSATVQNSHHFATTEDGYALIGRCLITESNSMQVSSDAIIVSQTMQPSIYWNNFVPYSSSLTIATMLENAIGSDKSIDDMDIAFASTDQRELVENDVTTRIGQKFIANGTNIQKISVLLSAAYDVIDGYDWSGDIVLTLNKLQTEVECPITPIPDNIIDFDPDPTIIGQISMDIDDLRYQGVVLNDDPQIVDFIFTNSNVSDPVRSPIEDGAYYVFTLSRSGDASIGTILVEEATDRIDNSYMTIYDGTQWINVTESDMWFVIYGDYVKIGDGIAYDSGIGVQIPRIKPNSLNVEEPYIEEYTPFYTVNYDEYNYILLETTDEFSDPKEDQRTGNAISSRITYVPEISSINSTALTTLLTTVPSPVLLAKIKDSNPRGNPLSITGTTELPGLVVYNSGDGYSTNTFNIIRPDADIIQNNLVGSILYPSTSCGGSTCEFRIISQTHYNDAYGDINGDGVIDLDDLNIINSWITTYTSIDRTSAQQSLLIDGTINAIQFLRADVNGDGIIDNTDKNLIENYINKVISTFSAGSTFSRTELVVENITDPLIVEADIANSCCTSFKTILTSPIPWRIDYVPSWIPDLLIPTDLRRLIPTTFVDSISTDKPKGQNNFYIPGDLYIDEFILNPDKTFYSVDFEVNHLSLDFPVTDSYGNPTFLDGYSGILLFDNFVAESSSGLTSSGFPAMKYASGQYVQTEDFVDNKVKITASIQSIANEYGITLGGTLKDFIGLYYDPSTSLLMLYIDNLSNDGYGNLLPVLSTKILVTVYLKQAGFINTTEFITKEQMTTLLGI